MGESATLELSDTAYASRRKELLQLVKQLRAIGAQAELDLPCITVIGNQSAGKSSVVEAISGINVPRDAGTCTRCPMECRLSSSDSPWTCQISIRWEFDKKGKRKDDVQEIAFGGTITDKGEVELALRRAQAAVLNPKVPSSNFLLMSLDKLKAQAHSPGSLEFSRNVVCVDLVGPDLTDLSFIDLPGIIQNAEPEIVKLVEDLVVSHIQGNCLILVALPMTDDIENQKALRLARQVDPNGIRTIGVLTKPDMLTSGATKARELWLDVIEGRRHPLHHGYYCTRQPDDAERTSKITTAAARKTESSFFDNTSPWSRSTQKNRFGTVNLVATLSRLLTQLINDILPTLDSAAQECLQACNDELSTLPKAIEAEPATYVLGLITSFSMQVQRYVQGGLDSGKLVHDNRDSFRQFKYGIRRTAPNFVPYPKATDADPQFENYIGDGEDEGPAEGLVSAQNPVYLLDMREHIEKSITRELPDDVPFPCKVSLIKAFQQTWHPTAIKCFDSVRDSMIKLLEKLLASDFGRYTHLYQHLMLLLTELVNGHQAVCLQRIEEILEIESEPFTQNGHYYDSCRDKWLAKYKDVRAGKTSQSIQRPSKVAKASGSVDVTGSVTPQPVINSTTFHFGKPSVTQPSQNGIFGAPIQSSPFAFSSFVPFAQNSNPPSDKTAPTAKTSLFGQPAMPSPDARASESSPKSTQSPLSANPASAQASNSPEQRTHDAASSPASSASTSGLAVPQPAAARVPFTWSGPTTEDDQQEKINAALAALAQIGYAGLTTEDLGKLNPPDVFTREINIMAQVRAYFQVSYKRVIDNVPLLIDHKFVRAIAKDMQRFLITELGLGNANASSRCAMYLAEDPIVVARREELTGRKKRLEGVKVELAKVRL